MTEQSRALQKPTNIYAEEENPLVNENSNIEKFAISTDQVGEPKKEEQTPTIPKSVYSALPTLLKKGTDVFDNERERDVFLTGALSVMSGSFTNISGSYDGYEVSPNLNTMVIAPPASGKSRMKFAEFLVRPLQQERIKKYEDELQKFKAKKKGITGIISSPTLETVFIPGNTSSAAIIKQLKDNNGTGIMFETEADMLGKAFNQDWGEFLSSLIRCSFQQETIRYQRATDSVYIEIYKPKLSIALSGTPDQVKPIINSIQNGLFSRFLYYAFNDRIEFKKIGKDVNGKNLTTHFESLGAELTKFVSDREKRKYEFEFTEDQFKSSYDFFHSRFKSAITFLGEEISSVIFRLGLIHYKICMVLSVLWQYDNKTDNNGLITCTDEDFKIGLELIEVYMQHSFHVFSSLQKPSIRQEFSLKEQFLSALPNGRFQTKDVNNLVPKIGKSERTLMYWLDEFVANGLVKKISHGIYEKVNK